MDQSQKIILTPFNLFEWKAEMDIFLREKGLYRINMKIQGVPNAATEKKLNGTTGGMRHMVFYV